MFKFCGSQTERRGPELSERASAPAALLLEDPGCIGCKSGANGGSRCHVEMDSGLFSMGLLFYQVTPASKHSCWDLKKRWGAVVVVSEFIGAILPGNAFQGGIKDLPVLGSKTSSAAFPPTFRHLKEIYSQVWERSNCRDISNRRWPEGEEE